MGRNKKKKSPYPDADVDINRPSLEKENEMLIEENIRLLAKIKKLESSLKGLTP